MKKPFSSHQKAKLKQKSVQYLVITHDEEGQRIDNFLLAKLKTVPKSRIYRILRKGEVRVNKGRIAASYRIKQGDSVRIPPISITEKTETTPPSQKTQSLLSQRILYEDDLLLVLNKPSGMSVHAGSTVRMGVIEAFRHLYPYSPHIELAHRLDSETSGCLILAKKKRVLRELHQLLREGKVTKLYWALTKGKWGKNELRVDLPLHKNYQDGGKHVVLVDKEGKSALTFFNPIHIYKEGTLVEVALMTGRTHQIRVHAASQGHPIAGDDRYGENDFNQHMRRLGLKRMFLHARSVDFILPSTGERIKVMAPLDEELETCLATLNDHN